MNDEHDPKSRLAGLLATMDIPEMRRDTDLEMNLRWLQRNLAINNGALPECAEALAIIRQLLGNQ